MNGRDDRRVPVFAVAGRVEMGESAVFVLDGLGTSLPHDERSGVMQAI
jgi:hypothetical protein